MHNASSFLYIAFLYEFWRLLLEQCSLLHFYCIHWIGDLCDYFWWFNALCGVGGRGKNVPSITQLLQIPALVRYLLINHALAWFFD